MGRPGFGSAADHGHRPLLLLRTAEGGRTRRFHQDPERYRRGGRPDERALGPRRGNGATHAQRVRRNDVDQRGADFQHSSAQGCGCGGRRRRPRDLGSRRRANDLTADPPPKHRFQRFRGNGREGHRAPHAFPRPSRVDRRRATGGARRRALRLASLLRAANRRVGRPRRPCWRSAPATRRWTRS